MLSDFGCLHNVYISSTWLIEWGWQQLKGWFCLVFRGQRVGLINNKIPKSTSMCHGPKYIRSEQMMHSLLREYKALAWSGQQNWESVDVNQCITGLRNQRISLWLLLLIYMSTVLNIELRSQSLLWLNDLGKESDQTRNWTKDLPTSRWMLYQLSYPVLLFRRNQRDLT